MTDKVFPARAGMSPHTTPNRTHIRGVPRASGDEPGGQLGLNDILRCSPRERG